MRGQHCAAYTADHQQPLHRRDPGRRVPDDRPDERLRQRRRQGQARAHDEVDGDCDEGKAEVVQADVESESHAEDDHRQIFARAREAFHPVVRAEQPRDYEVAPERQKGHELLYRGDQETHGHALHAFLLIHDDVGQHVLHVQVHPGLRAKINQQDPSTLDRLVFLAEVIEHEPACKRPKAEDELDLQLRRNLRESRGGRNWPAVAGDPRSHA
mmetsp:Transcript_79090/g.228700  ORF Transcript_79090/g.228700 Transcript_79090/m.228700 type:complete len:213 (+) Transcript_79090:758-1396(+)